MFDPNRIPTTSAADAYERLGGASDAVSPLLVDVREPDEIVEVRPVGGVAMPLSAFMARYRELPTDRPLLMICRSGARSAQATAFLLGNGWSDVTNVAGGILSWMQAGLPTRRGELDPGEGDLPS
ncbi:MAG: rhodanese-like domain-containing protein [Chloroflexota bacterium]